MFSSLFRKQPTVSARVSASDPTRPLRERLTAALAAKEYDDAVSLLVRLEAMEPRSPRWPHKRGDLLRQLQRYEHAFLAYATAVRLYNEEGHSERARAMAKTAVAGVSNLQTLLAQLDGITQAAFQASAF
jgi:hypothetical protein